VASLSFLASVAYVAFTDTVELEAAVALTTTVLLLAVEFPKVELAVVEFAAAVALTAGAVLGVGGGITMFFTSVILTSYSKSLSRDS
jgi:hypothetical protein